MRIQAASSWLNGFFFGVLASSSSGILDPTGPCFSNAIRCVGRSILLAIRDVAAFDAAEGRRAYGCSEPQVSELQPLGCGVVIYRCQSGGCWYPEAWRSSRTRYDKLLMQKSPHRFISSNHIKPQFLFQSKKRVFGRETTKKQGALFQAVWQDGGCNHMTCAFCGADFCWLCGRHLVGDSAVQRHYGSWNLCGCPGMQMRESLGRCPTYCLTPSMCCLRCLGPDS